MPAFDDVRRISLGLPSVERITWEVDVTFRVRDKIFAMGGPDGGRIGLDQGIRRTMQAELVDLDPETFAPSAYVGRFGWVTVDLGPRRAAAPGGPVSGTPGEEPRRRSSPRHWRAPSVTGAPERELPDRIPAQPCRGGTSSAPEYVDGRRVGACPPGEETWGSGAIPESRSTCCPTPRRARTRSSSAAEPATCRRGSLVAARGRSGSTTPSSSSRPPDGSRREHGRVPAHPRQRRGGPAAGRLVRLRDLGVRSVHLGGPVLRWVPEAFRLLRRGGELVFLVNGPC